VIGAVVGFARALRVAGVDVTTDRIQSMVAALDHLGPTGTDDLYWAGRLTMCAGPDDLRRFDEVFGAYFRSERPADRRPPANTVTVVGFAGRPDADRPARCAGPAGSPRRGADGSTRTAPYGTC
jgi:uncharacterized protein with von Willebrand factor type A (vWA) domain